MKYRTDIDGLRALAVTAVILFHLGFLPNGYLGVDVFFVISGYLITSIVYGKSARGTFSVLDFYERRVRRILPLTLVMTSLAFLLGLLYMLPDDLENLCQSVVASNVSANNILMYLTSADYWAVKNDYKPLMHTWSLGIEEQFYLLYPFLFFALRGPRLKYVKYVLGALIAASLAAFLVGDNVPAKFYFIQYRFFELAAGGLAALLFDKHVVANRKVGRAGLFGSLAALTALMFFPILETNEARVLTATALSLGVLTLGKQFFDTDRVYAAITANPVATFIGAISFSLYMWHQVIFAFARYAFLEEITPAWGAALTALTAGLSVLTYYGVENTFRDRKRVRTPAVLAFVGTLFVLSTSAAFYVYTIGGIIKDYPTLALQRDQLPEERNFFGRNQNIHIAFNENVRDLNADFDETTSRFRTLVVGNSFGRDVANVLLESEISARLQVRYAGFNELREDPTRRTRLLAADRIILAGQTFFGPDYLDELEAFHDITLDRSKIWVVGTKDFGYSNGIHYNQLDEIEDFTSYMTLMKGDAVAINAELKEAWGDRFIDLMELVTDGHNMVQVFTPEGKFISQDTVHLTKAGAGYIARLLADRFELIFDPRDLT